MKYLIVGFASVFLAAIMAVGVSIVEPEEADAATIAVRSCTGATVRLDVDERQMLSLHNQERASRGLPRLCVHPALQRAARAHSADMVQRDYFSHGNVGARLKRYGYNWRTYGENIGYNSTPTRMFNAWMRSPGHRSNILNRNFREIGVGAVTGDYKGNRTTMWTADFGTRSR